MDYKTIANDGIVEEEIKKSRFICHLKRISREEEGRGKDYQVIVSRTKELPDA